MPSSAGSAGGGYGLAGCKTHGFPKSWRDVSPEHETFILCDYSSDDSFSATPCAMSRAPSLHGYQTLGSAPSNPVSSTKSTMSGIGNYAEYVTRHAKPTICKTRRSSNILSIEGRLGGLS